MMDWDKLRVFHTVAEAGSFTRAGVILNSSQSAVSRQIISLENALGVSLFHRHARGLILTEQGDLLYQTTHEVFGKLAMVEARLHDSKQTPTGKLTVTTSEAFGSTWLVPRMKGFVDDFPEIDATLLLDDTVLDLSMRQADVALRMHKPTQPDLIQRHLVTLGFHIYATKEYLDAHGRPQSVAELADHVLLTYPEGREAPFGDVNWLPGLLNAEGKTPKQLLQVNGLYAIYRGVKTGIGLGALPDYMTAEAPEMEMVLPEVTRPSVDVYFIYPEEMRHSKRITVFRDYLLDRISETRF